MFAADQIIWPVWSQADAQKIEEDLDVLIAWSKWLLKFNILKCKIVHCGKRNPRFTYNMKCDGDLKQLETTECEMDLGVYICNTLKPTVHCCKAAYNTMSALTKYGV